MTKQLPVLCCVPLTSKRLRDSDARATAEVFKALADAHRVQIVNLLSRSDEPVCVCDITDHLSLSQPTVSFHLKKLTSAGILRREKRGTWAYYSIDESGYKQIARIFEQKGA